MRTGGYRGGRRRRRAWRAWICCDRMAVVSWDFGGNSSGEVEGGEGEESQPAKDAEDSAGDDMRLEAEALDVGGADVRIVEVERERAARRGAVLPS